MVIFHGYVKVYQRVTLMFQTTNQISIAFLKSVNMLERYVATSLNI